MVNGLKFPLSFEFLCEVPDTVNELGLGDRHGNVEHSLRHPALMFPIYKKC